MPEYLLAALAWSAWCLMHSLLIWPSVMGPLKRLAGRFAPAYRLAYNLFSALTLLPLAWLHIRLHGPDLIRWRGLWMAVPLVLDLGAAVLFVLGARAYGAADFLGWRSARSALRNAPAEAEAPFRHAGVLAWVRHPWYAGALLVLWGHDLDSAGLAASLMLTLYVLVGTHLEERKLVAAHGDAYRDYQRRVPMFIPRRPRRMEQ